MFSIMARENDGSICAVNQSSRKNEFELSTDPWSLSQIFAHDSDSEDQFKIVRLYPAVGTVFSTHSVASVQIRGNFSDVLRLSKTS